MTTILIGTDGEAASEVICDYLEDCLSDADTVYAVNVEPTHEDSDKSVAGRKGLVLVKSRLGDLADVNTRQLETGSSPARELLSLAEGVDADEIVIGLRHHSMSDRIIFGSTAASILKQTTRPVIAVPLSE